MMARLQERKVRRFFLIVSCGAGGLLLAVALFLLISATDAKRALANYIVQHPEAAAVVAYTIDEQGELVEDEKTILYNADQPMVLASTMKLIVLAAYAQAVAEGELNADEQVPVAAWEAYYLPNTDGGAHRASLQALGLEADDLGFAKDQTGTIALIDIARAMMHYSCNASTDYLLAHLGEERMAGVMEAAGMEQHTPIYSLLGTALIIANHEQPAENIEQIQASSEALAAGQTVYLDYLTTQYLHDPEWRAAQIAFLSSAPEAGTIDLESGWLLQLAAASLLPRGTAREYAQLMALVASETFISLEVIQTMRQILETVPSDEPLRLVFFERYGAKDGVTAGTLTLASYAISRRGATSGQTRVVVILTNGLPYSLWRTQLQYQGIYLLQTDLARETGLFDGFESR